ncbi:hypothetical protein [Azohydromonas aeria]|uniref:hypothetical protein n=1 Tax=Azohydromonas aeria TaxID=2590212 RepID=UPI0012FCAB86|nr:hypothetical protein [Azohydromonas aeria]
MGDLYATDAALAEQATADAFEHSTCDRARLIPWDVLGFLAGLLLALASAPFVSY